MAHPLPKEPPPPRAPVGATDIARALSRGDAAAFETLYRVWFPRTLIIARVLTRRDESFCLDVVQEVMLRAARRLPQFRSEAELSAWFSRATLSAAIDQLRKDRRRTRREHASQVNNTREGGVSLAMSEDLTILRGAFAKLPAADQALLMQRIAHGLTLQQAGATLGITTQAAHGRIRRALAHLRNLLYEVLP